MIARAHGPWRLRGRVAGVVLATLLVAGCSTTVDGTGRPAAGGFPAVSGSSSGTTKSSTTDAPTTDAPTTDAPTSDAPTSAAASPTSAADTVETPAQLAALLVEVPSDARADGTAWGENHTPTLDEFGARIYRAEAGGTDPGDYLRQSGVLAITHIGWLAEDGHAADIALLLFDDATEPPAWMASETSAMRDAGALRVSLDDVDAAVGYTFTQKSEDGSTVTRFHAVRGRVGMLVDYFYDGAFDPADASTWIGAQYARLG